MHTGKMFITYCFVATIFLGSFDVAVIADSQINSKNIVPSNFNESKAPSDLKSLTFNIPDVAGGYETFIESMRTLLTRSRSHGIPILKPQPASPEKPATMSWLDIRLVANAKSITVRIEQSNLYVYGYVRSGETRFWEFMPDPNKVLLINQSQSLGFSGSYTGLERAAGQGRSNIPLGVDPLRNAVYGLAKIDKPNVGADRTTAARHLIIVLQMLSEAARFKTISTFISSNWGNPMKITNRMLALENDWSKLSTAVQSTASTAKPNTALPNIPPNSPAGVYTLGDAVDVFGIMLLKK